MANDPNDDLGARIRAAQEAMKPKKTAHDKQAESAVNAGGLALRYGTEMAACVLVGVVMGLAIDSFLGTKPWGFLFMLGLGLAAGILGVIRAYKQINADMAKAAQQETMNKD